MNGEFAWRFPVVVFEWLAPVWMSLADEHRAVDNGALMGRHLLQNEARRLTLQRALLAGPASELPIWFWLPWPLETPDISQSNDVIVAS